MQTCAAVHMRHICLFGPSTTFRAIFASTFASTRQTCLLGPPWPQMPRSVNATLQHKGGTATSAYISSLLPSIAHVVWAAGISRPPARKPANECDSQWLGFLLGVAHRTARYRHRKRASRTEEENEVAAEQRREADAKYNERSVLLVIGLELLNLLSVLSCRHRCASFSFLIQSMSMISSQPIPQQVWTRPVQGGLFAAVREAGKKIPARIEIWLDRRGHREGAQAAHPRTQAEMNII